MNNLVDVKQQVLAMAQDASKIREAAKQFLMPKEGTEEAKDPRRMGDAHGAVEAVCSIVNIFASLKNPSINGTFMLLTDLTVALNTNAFWVRNVGSLMPMLIAAVNGSHDARELEAVKSVSAVIEERWEPLRIQGERLWLEMLPQIVFLVHGYATMRGCSVEIKKTFDGLVNG